MSLTLPSTFHCERSIHLAHPEGGIKCLQYRPASHSMGSEPATIASPEVSSAKHDVTTEADTRLKQHPQSLKRGAFTGLLNVCSDVFAILVWSGMLVYAIILWYFNGALVKVMPFTAQKLLTAARPVSFQPYRLLSRVSLTYRSFRHFFRSYSLRHLLDYYDLSLFGCLKEAAKSDCLTN